MTNILFRKFKTEDCDDLYAALNDKRVVKHMASSGITLEDCKNIIAGSLAHWEKYQIGSYAVIDDANARVIGWAGFKWWKDNEFEIVIVISPTYFGYGEKICDELLNKAKNEFHLNAVYILLPETRKSFNWIKKKGFVFIENEVFNNQPFKKFVKIL